MINGDDKPLSGSERYSKLLKLILPINVLFLFACLYIFLPTNNSSIDAYNYAANIKWNHDLFFPHHLLYNYFQSLIFKITKYFHLTYNVLGLMKFVNSIAALFSLCIFYLITKKLNDTDEAKDHNLPLYLLLFTGSSFGLMRYATENETYVLPIFWSLLASYFFLQYILKKKSKYLLLSGLMASTACLFHQIHVFWYLGLVLTLLFYKGHISKTLILSFPSLIIPILYYFAYRQQHFEITKAQNLWQFILYDYYYGTANTNFGFQNFVLGIIGFVRTFLQIHGIIPLIIKKIPLYSIVLFPFLLFLFGVIRGLIKNKIKKISPCIFVKAHLLIFIMQFSFAIFSFGNAEFMVMLPFLFILVMNGFIQLKGKIYLHTAMAMIIWNISFGLFPNYYFNLQNQFKTIDLIHSAKNSVFILSEDVLVQNIIYYETGVPWNSNIYKSPASIKLLGMNTHKLSKSIDSCLNNKIAVYTDCIDEPFVLSRKTWLQQNENELFFKDYRVHKVDSILGLTGTKYLFLIDSKKESSSN